MRLFLEKARIAVGLAIFLMLSAYVISEDLFGDHWGRFTPMVVFFVMLIPTFIVASYIATSGEKNG